MPNFKSIYVYSRFEAIVMTPYDFNYAYTYVHSMYKFICKGNKRESRLHGLLTGARWLLTCLALIFIILFKYSVKIKQEELIIIPWSRNATY